MARYLRIIALGAALALLASCASTKLAEYRFNGETIRISVQAAPDSRVQASYNLDIDMDDPISTIVSIGTSVAKASQVAALEDRLARAHSQLDITTTIADEVTLFYEEVMGMEVVSGRGSSDYALRIDVEHYGIEAGSWGSAVSFELQGTAEIYDTYTGERIWRDWFHQSEPASPTFFGLPQAAGNIVSAAMLADLSEDQIAAGIERLARDAAWDLSREFERDLYRARRRQ